MVPLGISSAAAVRVGHQLGRGDPTRAHLAGWSAILLGAGFMTCTGLAFVTASKQIANLFSPDLAVIRVGATLLLVAAAFQLFDGLQTVATGALRCSGDTRTPMLANLVAYWFIGLPFGYVLCFRIRLRRAGNLDCVVHRLNDHRERSDLFAWHKRLRSKVSLADPQ